MDSVGSGSLCVLSVPCVVPWTRLLLLPWDVSLCMEPSKSQFGSPLERRSGYNSCSFSCYEAQIKVQYLHGML